MEANETVQKIPDEPKVAAYTPQDIAELIETRKAFTDGDESKDRLIATIMLLVEQQANIKESYTKQRTLLATLIKRQGGSVLIRQAELLKLPKEFNMQIDASMPGEFVLRMVVPREKVLVL